MHILSTNQYGAMTLHQEAVGLFKERKKKKLSGNDFVNRKLTSTERKITGGSQDPQVYGL